MFQRIKRLFSPGLQSVEEIIPYPDGKRYYREHHSLRREQADQDAIKVINRLNRNGYRSYLVGGSVRDMLLGKRPKDFDVVTTATPSQIRNLFSNSRAIGRRFKIVHVIFRGKIIEVSTFRSLPEHRLTGKMEKGEDLMMLRDNQYGNPREDAARRDFTINALYFDPRNESIIDYVGGYDDILNKRLSVIGDPNISFQEDPVRMLRAAKFAALLDLKIDGACFKAIKKNSKLINRASPSRLLEEYSKIFRTGKTTAIFASFANTGLLKSLFPEAWEGRTLDGKSQDFLDSSLGKRLEVADRKLTEREDLTINVFMALLFADLVKKVLVDKVDKNLVEYIKSRILPVCKRMHFPVKDRDRLIQIFASQPRFHKTEGTKKQRPEFFRKKHFFYEAFMVFKIIAIATGDDEAVQKAMFWEFGPRTRPPEANKVITLFTRRSNFSGEHKKSEKKTDKKTGTSKKSGGKKDSRKAGKEKNGKENRDGAEKGGEKKSSSRSRRPRRKSKT